MSENTDFGTVSAADRDGPDVHRIPRSLLASLWGALPDWVPRTLVSPLLATLTTAVLVCGWFALPLTRDLGWTENQMLVLTGATWLVTLVGWVAALRSPKRGWRMSLVEMSTRRSMSLLDLVIWLGFAVIAYLAGAPLTWMLAGLLTVSYAVLLTAPDRDVALEDTPEYQHRRRIRRTIDPGARPEEALSTEYTRVQLAWDMTPLGVPYKGSTELVVNLDRLHSMRRLNPESPSRVPGVPYPSAAVNEWIVRGTTEEIDRLALTLSNAAADQGFTQEQKALLVLALVQGIPYTLDIDSTGKEEYWRYPVETIADNTGDCEDTTILAAAILRRMGYDVAMIFTDDHAALGIANLPKSLGVYIDYRGRRYSYCETTAEGWIIGNLPSGVALEDLKLIATARAASLAGLTGD